MYVVTVFSNDHNSKSIDSNVIGIFDDLRLRERYYGTMKQTFMNAISIMQ